MPYDLRRNTASQEVPLGKFVSTADGDTPMTGLTINASDIKLYKNGASSSVNKNSGGATHDAGGIYVATLDATDTNTVGPLVIFVQVATALYVKQECRVLHENVYDVLYGTVAPSTLTAAAVNAEVVDVVSVDTWSLPGQMAPPATPTLVQATLFPYKNLRNRKRQTPTQYELFDDAGTTVDQKATISKTTGEGVFGELVSGP